MSARLTEHENGHSDMVTFCKWSTAGTLGPA